MERKMPEVGDTVERELVSNIRLSPVLLHPFAGDGIEFYIHGDYLHEGGHPVVARELEFEVMEPLTRMLRGQFWLSMRESQALMDNLWRCGLRPSEGTGSAGALAAVQKHLEDMRKIVAKKLGVEL
jgi:hypothetical protein